MSQANTVDTQLAMAKEQEWGVTPSSPIFQKLRITGESLNGNFTTVTSQELRPDRNVTDVTPVAANAGGGINIEMSYGTFDDLLAALLFNEWQGNALTNGPSENLQSFTLEKRFTTDRGTYEYFRYAGMVPNSMTLNLGVDGIITGSFDFMGKREEADSTLIPGATYQEPTTSKVLNATDDFVSFSLGGEMGNYVSSMTLTISNNLRSQRAVGHFEGIGVGTGQFAVTGSMSVYFKSRALYDKFIKGEAVAFSFILGEEGGKQYKFTLPKLKFSSVAVQAGGTGQDLMQEMQFQGVITTDIGGTIRIERAVGVAPAQVAATGVGLDMTTLSLEVGNSGTLIATVQPDNATNKNVTWESDNTAIATVSGGVVTGVAVGTATITATTGSHTATCEVIVA